MKKIWESIYAFLKLIRVQNLIILLLLQYFGRFFLIDNDLTFKELLLEPEIFILSISTLLVAAAGYIINDYYDIKIDMINKPDQVVIGKVISRRNAIILHICLNSMALGMSYFILSWRVALFMTFCTFLLWIYSNYFKRTPFLGNLIISFLAFSSLFLLYLFYKSNLDKIVFFSIFSLLTTLIREITKDMEDMRGDEVFECKTLPIILGIKKTKIIVYAIMFVTVSSIIASNYFIPNTLYLFLLLGFVCPFIYFGIKLGQADKKSDYSIVNFGFKILMVIGICSMVILKI